MNTATILKNNHHRFLTSNNSYIINICFKRFISWAILITFNPLMILATPILQYPNALDREELLKVKTLMESQTHTNHTYSIYTLNTKKNNLIIESIETLIPQSSLIYNETNQQLIALHPKQTKKTLDSLIKSLNKPEPMIKIDFNIYEISLETDQELNAFTLPLQTGITLKTIPSISIEKPTSLIDTIKMLEQQGKALLLANPCLIIENGTRGALNIGEHLPYLTTTSSSTNQSTTLHHLNTGISVSIIPTQLENDHIQCALDMDISLIKLFKVLDENEYPVLSTRKLTSSLNIKNNQKGFVTSFINKSEQNNTTSIPLLSKLPIIKHLFSHKKNKKKMSAICVFITPSIL